MNLNPFYHLRRYRELHTENEELRQRVQWAEAEIKTITAEQTRLSLSFASLRQEFNELEQGFAVVVASRYLSRKEARAQRHKHQRGRNAKPELPR